jgi:hypothetical protein
MGGARSTDSIILGYDPGGDHKHGVAALSVVHGAIVKVEVATARAVESALGWFRSRIDASKPPRIGLGVDTLTVWSTGPSGWRPADRLLRAAYPAAANSVVASNSLYGAMAVNGMLLMARLREQHPTMVISETHPKVLFQALASTRYDYRSNAVDMGSSLAQWLGAAVPPLANDHEWDAIASAYAAWQGCCGRWSSDLHLLHTSPGESLLWPVGRTSFYWPTLPKAASAI